MELPALRRSRGAWGTRPWLFSQSPLRVFGNTVSNTCCALPFPVSSRRHDPSLPARATCSCLARIRSPPGHGGDVTRAGLESAPPSQPSSSAPEIAEKSNHPTSTARVTCTSPASVAGRPSGGASSPQASTDARKLAYAQVATATTWPGQTFAWLSHRDADAYRAGEW